MHAGAHCTPLSGGCLLLEGVTAGLGARRGALRSCPLFTGPYPDGGALRSCPLFTGPYPDGGALRSCPLFTGPYPDGGALRSCPLFTGPYPDGGALRSCPLFTGPIPLRRACLPFSPSPLRLSKAGKPGPLPYTCLEVSSPLQRTLKGPRWPSWGL
jgi:hypothetical protein